MTNKQTIKIHHLLSVSLIPFEKARKIGHESKPGDVGVSRLGAIRALPTEAPRSEEAFGAVGADRVVLAGAGALPRRWLWHGPKRRLSVFPFDFPFSDPRRLSVLLF